MSRSKPRAAALVASALAAGTGTWPAPAWADELEVRERGGLLDDAPGLQLDPMFRPSLEGIAPIEDTHETQIRLGPKTELVIQGTSWINDATGIANAELGADAIDSAARGWRARVRLSHDVGLFRIDATGSVNQVDSRYGAGTYTDVGISLTRTRRLSRWMTGWISLGANVRRWQGHPPPPGEANATQVHISIGTTFR